MIRRGRRAVVEVPTVLAVALALGEFVALVLDGGGR